jgi:teichoic acid transport system ATP-binding protein
LFVSHDTTAVRRFCHRTVWLNKGTIIAMGDTNEIADQYEDYLRCVDIPDVESEMEAVKVENEPTFIPVQDGSIAKVVQVTVCDDRGRPVETVSCSKPIKVTVSYNVYDTAVTDTVLGVALYRLDGDYICGLNTLLDHRAIPWKYGRNRFSIRYPQGLRVLGGQYYFDVALIDQTVTVGIDYKTRIRDIRVDSGYLGEGRLILPHDWEDSTIGLVLE